MFNYASNGMQYRASDANNPGFTNTIRFTYNNISFIRVISK